MVLPKMLMEEFSRKLNFYSCTVPVMDQYTLASFIDQNYFEKHINRMRKQFFDRGEKRRDDFINLFRNIFSCFNIKFILQLLQYKNLAVWTQRIPFKKAFIYPIETNLIIENQIKHKQIIDIKLQCPYCTLYNGTVI